MTGIFGMTGSGKTNAGFILNAQIIDNSPKTAKSNVLFSLIDFACLLSLIFRKDRPLSFLHNEKDCDHYYCDKYRYHYYG